MPTRENDAAILPPYLSEPPPNRTDATYSKRPTPRSQGRRDLFITAAGLVGACLISSRSAKADVPLESASAETDVVDVRTFGAELNGINDDSKAFMAAYNSMLVNGHPMGTLLVPVGTAYLGSGLTFNLGYPDPGDNYGGGAGEHFAFVTHGVLKPAAGIGTAVLVENGYSPVIDIKFFGGGSAPDVALALQGLVGASVAVEGRNFGGTLLQADATGDTTKHVRAVNYMSVCAINCGRAINFKYIEAFGQIENVVDFNCVNGSYFGYCEDIGIGHYENYSPATQSVGLFFEQCNGLHLDCVSLGSSATEALMKITGGDFGYIHELRAGGWQGSIPGGCLKLMDVKSLDIGFLETFTSPVGLHVMGCGKIAIGTHRSLTGDYNAVLIEAGSVFTTAVVHISKAMYYYTSYEAVKVAGSVTGGRLVIGGEIELEQVMNPAEGYTILSASPGFYIYAEGLQKVYLSFLLKAFSTPNNAALVHVTGGAVSNWP